MRTVLKLTGTLVWANRQGEIMPIQNDEQLADVVARVGEDLQAIQNYLGRESAPAGKIRFPRGFIRTASTHRQRLPFVTDATLKHNMAYGLILSDVYFWILLRTDLTGTAKEMVVKASIFLAGALAESLTKHFLIGTVGNQRGFQYRTTRLVSDGVITPELKDDLDWVWNNRNNMHYFLVDDREYQRYTLADYNRAGYALRSLIAALQASHAAMR